MTLEYNTINYESTMSIGGAEIEGFLYQDPFGPSSASGVISDIHNLDRQYVVGHFTLSYPSVLPDGAIDTSYGDALGDITGGMQDVYGTGFRFSYSFFIVPEPSSIVQAASAILIIGILAQLRRLGRRRRSRPA